MMKHIQVLINVFYNVQIKMMGLLVKIYVSIKMAKKESEGSYKGSK